MSPQAIHSHTDGQSGIALDVIKPSATALDIQAYDHVTWWVGNAKQAASYYVTRMGFSYLAYQGLETGSKYVASYAITNSSAVFVLRSPIRGLASINADTPESDKELVEAMHAHLEKHGDAVKDIALKVDDAEAVYETAIAQGAIGVQEPTAITDMADGTLVTAVIATYGDTTHTLVERSSYRGVFMPGYSAMIIKDPLSQNLPEVPIEVIDHCVGNQGWNEMEAICKYYETSLGFYRFWSVDDREMCSDFSAMSSVVMASGNGAVKLPINEPAVGKKRSQIEEFVDFYGGPGVQHIALRTNDIITSVENLRKRGTQFIAIPGSYYDTMRLRLKNSNLKLEEDFAAIQRNNILIDFDEGGYLLQIFTKPMLDRPTVFLEVIQRNNFDGFGAGNFKALFEAVERDQAARGNL